MKLGILLGIGLVALFAGLSNFWFGDVRTGLWMIGAFCVIAGISAWLGKRDYDARPVQPPIHERAVTD